MATATGSVVTLARWKSGRETNPPHFASRQRVAHIMGQYLMPCDHDDGYAVYLSTHLFFISMFIRKATVLSLIEAGAKIDRISRLKKTTAVEQLTNAKQAIHFVRSVLTTLRKLK